MDPLRILCCCLIKDTVVIVVMVGSRGPFSHPTLLSNKRHHGPSYDDRESWALSASCLSPIKDIY